MRHRPPGIWIIVFLQIGLTITLLPGVAETFEGVSPVPAMSLSDLGRSIYAAYALVTIMSALWLWTLSRRGWALTMVVVGIGLLANLVLWYAGHPHFVRMAVLSLTALYLNTSQVQQLFERREEISTIRLSESEPS